MTAPSLTALPFEAWSFSASVAEASTLAALGYLVMLRRAARWPHRRTLAFLSGLLAIQVAIQSGIDTYDGQLLSAHMVQHLMLIELAPALLLYGRPVHLALKTLAPRERHALGRALVRTRRLATPSACLALYTAIVLGTHTPVFFDAALQDQTLHDTEHALYLVAGLAVWWPLLGDPAPKQRPGAIGQLAYLTVAMVPMTLIGAYLNRDPTLLYTAYGATDRGLGVSALAVQQQAGAIMWVAGTSVMAGVGLLSVLSGLLAAERRQQARELREVAP